MYYIYYYIYVKLPVYIISVSTNAFRQLSLNDDAVAICTGVAPTFISIYDEPPRSQTGGGTLVTALRQRTTVLLS